MRIGSGRRQAKGLVAVALLLAACGSADSAVDSPSTEAAPTATVTSPHAAPSTETETETEFPVSVDAANGEVTIDARPERIVVLSASLTESVYAVGAGEQVVAVDSASNHPAGVPVTDLSGFRPNVEAIGKFDPDLVLASRDRDDLVATLESLGIDVLVLPSAADLAEVYAQIETIGVATGHADTATELAESMRAEIDGQLGRVAEFADAPTYFYELSSDFHTNTSNTFVGSVLAALGLTNIADGVDPAAGSYPQISAEYVLESDPAWLFVAHTDASVPTLAELAARPGWGTMSAVASGRVVMLDVDVASRWGPRVVDLVSEIVDALAAGEGSAGS